MARKRLGEVLREGNFVSAADLEAVLAEQQERAGKLGELLCERGLITREQLATALETVLCLKYINPLTALPAEEALRLIPRELCYERMVVPHSLVDGRKLAVVMAEPQDLSLVDELRFRTGMEIVPRIGFADEILHALELNKPAEDTSGPERLGVNAQLQFISTSTSERANQAMREFQAELHGQSTPAVRVVSAILDAAFRRHASDIHIEPLGSSAVVRLRIDGMLRQMTTLTPDVAPNVISRLKILADMDIAERRVPQDGRFLVETGGRKFDIRVSTLPTHEGEKVVMRVLDSAATEVRFTHLGMPPEMAMAVEKILRSPSGMLLVTGPTGSGKSTTLYAALSLVKNSTLNVVTVEDPVEYRLEGINQVQVNPKAGLTFAGCLRSILRQDPNIIMVGEVRDRETAEIALQAAQTGHLVLSTLHTNDAVSAVTRLLDLGIPPFLVASSVRGIMAQRLVRRLCECRQILPSGLAESVGCSRCEQTGYRGRFGVYELLALDEPLRAGIRAGSRDDELRRVARNRGMRTMVEDAMDKVELGLTTLEEVYRVVPSETVNAAQRCCNCNHEFEHGFAFCPFCGTATDAPKPEAVNGPHSVPIVRHRHMLA